jgi:hypothetical protein
MSLALKSDVIGTKNFFGNFFDDAIWENPLYRVLLSYFGDLSYETGRLRL